MINLFQQWRKMSNLFHHRQISPANLNTEVTRKQSLPNFSENKHFLPPNMCFVFLLPPFWDSPFCLTTYEFISETNKSRNNKKPQQCYLKFKKRNKITKFSLFQVYILYFSGPVVYFCNFTWKKTFSAFQSNIPCIELWK